MQLFFRAFLALIALAITLAAGGYFYLRQSLPKTSGELPVAGLAAPVEILRDGHGIPHIYAQSERDAYFALGYAHAQDRLWQMEMNRRIGAGRTGNRPFTENARYTARRRSQPAPARCRDTKRIGRLRGGRQRVSRCETCPPARALDAAADPRAVDRGGLGSLGEDDGLGLGRKLA